MNLSIFSGEHKPNITIGDPAELEARLAREERQKKLESKLPENKSVPPQPSILPSVTQSPNGNPSIDALVNNGKAFYDTSMPIALTQAMNFAGQQGVVASLPYLIAGKANSDKSTNYLWSDWFTSFSEENVGIDTKGRFVKAGNPVVITVHGGGILTSDRISQAYEQGLTDQNAAKYTSEEFTSLLNGILPSKERIQIYTLDDIKKGRISTPFSRYAIALDFETAKATKSGYHKKTGFMSNPLVLARAGTSDYLEQYFNKAKDSDGDVGNHHRLSEIDYRQSQGRLLFVNYNYNGLNGYYNLDFNGRFVGVAPEAHSAKKKGGSQ